MTFQSSQNTRMPRISHTSLHLQLLARQFGNMQLVQAVRRLDFNLTSAESNKRLLENKYKWKCDPLCHSNEVFKHSCVEFNRGTLLLLSPANFLIRQCAKLASRVVQ